MVYHVPFPLRLTRLKESWRRNDQGEERKSVRFTFQFSFGRDRVSGQEFQVTLSALDSLRVFLACLRPPCPKSNWDIIGMTFFPWTPPPDSRPHLLGRKGLLWGQLPLSLVPFRVNLKTSEEHYTFVQIRLIKPKTSVSSFLPRSRPQLELMTKKWPVRLSTRLKNIPLFLGPPTSLLRKRKYNDMDYLRCEEERRKWLWKVHVSKDTSKVLTSHYISYFPAPPLPSSSSSRYSFKVPRTEDYWEHEMNKIQVKTATRIKVKTSLRASSLHNLCPLLLSLSLSLSYSVSL